MTLSSVMIVQDCDSKCWMLSFVPGPGNGFPHKNSIAHADYSLAGNSGCQWKTRRRVAGTSMPSLKAP